MEHRHLHHQRFTLAAIDDVVARGAWPDWVRLRLDVLHTPTTLDKLERVCQPRVSNADVQWHRFWRHYAEYRRAAQVSPQPLGPGGPVSPGAAPSKLLDRYIPLNAERVLQDLHQLELFARSSTSSRIGTAMWHGHLDGIETGIWECIRTVPLEFTAADHIGVGVCTGVPTETETLRIKSMLILLRNAAQDYREFAALASHMGVERSVDALIGLDQIYAQTNGASPLQQLLAQLADARPFDATPPTRYENDWPTPQEPDWLAVQRICAHLATTIFDRMCDLTTDDYGHSAIRTLEDRV
jgi:hypothetical protein